MHLRKNIVLTGKREGLAIALGEKKGLGTTLQPVRRKASFIASLNARSIAVTP